MEFVQRSFWFILFFMATPLHLRDLLGTALDWMNWSDGMARN